MKPHQAVACLVTLVSSSSLGWAQDAPPIASGLAAPKTATTGSTEVATSSFEGQAKPEVKASNDATEAKLSAGALVTTGNARAMSTTAAGTFRLRRSENQLSVAAALNYAKSKPPTETRMATTAENYQGKARYDRFVSKHVALFGALSLRKDEFQGLDVRLNLDPGVAYYFIDDKPVQLWTELGYDYQYDLRTLDAVRAANATLAVGDEQLSRKQSRHSGRLFVGYVTAVNDNVSLTSGVEYLQALTETENWRLVADAGINATLSGKLSLSTTLTVRYDHNPLPKLQKTDTIESVNLVYTLL